MQLRNTPLYIALWISIHHTTRKGTDEFAEPQLADRQSAPRKRVRALVGGALGCVCKSQFSEPKAAWVGVDEFAEPELEHEERPDVGGAIGAAGGVVVDQGLDGTLTEVATLEGAA